MSEREREARAAEREAVRESLEHERIERWKDRQRETLIELQEVLHDLGRTYGQEHNQDLMTARKAGHWDRRLLAGDISDRNQQAEAGSNILVARVGDKQVRDAVQEMKTAGANLTFANSREESDAELGNSWAAFDRANERIGVLLREV